MTAIQSLRDRVKENSEFFDHMLDLIPAKFYLHPEQSEEDLIKVRSDLLLVTWFSFLFSSGKSISPQ